MNDISIDIETLSTRFNAAVLSIGAVAFDRRTAAIGQKLYVEIEIESSLLNGHVSGTTLEWWMQQSDAARRVFGGRDKLHLASALQRLSSFVNDYPGARVWGNGATFDITILEHAYGSLFMEVPWKFWNIRDMRTILEAATEAGFDKRSVTFQGTAHNAVDDAEHQARVIAASWAFTSCSANALRPAETAAIVDVLEERNRQVENEEWSLEHDDGHPSGEIAAFAAVYAMPPEAREWPAAETGYGPTFGTALCPENWQPKFGDRRRELVKAGALIVAEIERLDRAATRATKDNGEKEK